MKTYREFIGEAQWMYHGTPHALEGGKLVPDRSNRMIDRAIGSHFAADPEVSKKFAKDKGNVFKTRTIPRSKLQKMSSKGWDQSTIGAHVSGTVFSQPEHKELFKSWAKHARQIDEPTAERLHAHLAAGKAPSHPSFGTAQSKANSFQSYMQDYDSGLHTHPHPDFPKQVVNHYLDIMKKRNKEGLTYRNTSPEETRGVRSRKSYVIFHPEKLNLET